ncbi:hypothetical protein QZQ18_18910 [Serratia marcescens]|uniref:hypothetical protein n=1 Tax=Serratia marcescens TaxID=615 RepID=UPI00277A4518|nr:hypothetical protein [Serratia marcescens]MDP8601537.1 hypothetical protein [Serratia marcescens]MDP8686237.1 hypothetical protein [Serratia marcescens]MDP8795135.1 hypothetical protein [Serratia marcescens]
MKNIVENQDIKTDKPLPMSYEALKAERDALAVENAALNKSLDDVCESYENGQSDLLSEAIDKAINLPSPATDAALAAIQAQGVEKAAAALDALSAQSASATTKANFRAAAVYLRAEVLPVIGEAK